MIFVDKEDLQYYHPNTNDYCYCELLIFPSDLTLQFRIPSVDNTAFLIIEAYTPDGETVLLSDIDDRYIAVFAKDTYGNYYCNIKLLSFPPALCQKCFVLRVTCRIQVAGENKTIFDKYTQEYCIDDCCTVDGVLTAEYANQTQTLTSTANYTVSYRDNCKKPVFRLETRFDCLDNFTDEYYGAAQEIIWGENNPDLEDVLFRKVTNLRGLFKRLPRDIKRTIALNCSTQKSESSKLFLLQSSDTIPAWKMTEIEDQFHAPYIDINNERLQFSGGVIFERLQKYQQDPLSEFYRLNMEIEACRKWQTFGCEESCINYNSQRIYGFTESDIFTLYNEDGARIGTSIGDLLIYMQSLPNTESAIDVSYVYIPLGYTYAVLVTGMGVLPPFIYANQVGADSKVFGVFELPDLTNPCGVPSIGTIFDEIVICHVPVFGTLFDEVYPDQTDEVYSHIDWEVQVGSTASLTANTVSLTFTTRNASLGNGDLEPVYINGDVIGVVNGDFVPVATRVINTNLPANTYIIITTSGEIQYYGEAPTVQAGYAEIEILNLIYNI